MKDESQRNGVDGSEHFADVPSATSHADTSHPHSSRRNLELVVNNTNTLNRTNDLIEKIDTTLNESSANSNVNNDATPSSTPSGAGGNNDTPSIVVKIGDKHYTVTVTPNQSGGSRKRATNKRATNKRKLNKRKKTSRRRN